MLKVSCQLSLLTVFSLLALHRESGDSFIYAMDRLFVNISCRGEQKIIPMFYSRTIDSVSVPFVVIEFS
jgi:hypothetical protein